MYYIRDNVQAGRIFQPAVQVNYISRSYLRCILKKYIALNY